jgi:peroxiredoxin (alkyl hydroperoxide reductase subunit C)
MSSILNGNGQLASTRRMIGLGEKFPTFNKKTVVSTEVGKEFARLDSAELVNKNDRWTVMFWWPKDFTFVCPTEIAEFNNAFGAFNERNTFLIGASTDSEYVHLAWRKDHADLRGLRFPMLADTSKSLAEDLGILTAEEKVAYRVTYIIDPEGMVRWVSAYDLKVGRNVDEVVRVLDALRTGERTPCNWHPGAATLGR